MITISQQPGVFKPTLLPAMTTDSETAASSQPTQEDTMEPSTIVVPNPTNLAESMDAQPQSD